MEITIKATPKEIADLVREVQSQQLSELSQILYSYVKRQAYKHKDFHNHSSF